MTGSAYSTGTPTGHLEAYFGIPGIGSVLLLLNIRLAPPDLSYVVNHAETKFVLVDETLIPIAEAIAGQCDTIKGYIILTDKDLSEIKTSLTPIYSYEELLADADTDIEWPELDEKSAYGRHAIPPAPPAVPKGCIIPTAMFFFMPMTIGTNAEMTSNDCFYQLGAPCFTRWDGACLRQPFSSVPNSFCPACTILLTSEALRNRWFPKA